ncbi:MAG: ATP-binding protein [Terriglobia bacterium]
MTTPIERLSNLVVGVVEYVSPEEVRVLLDLDAPQATALNTGTPAPFPRLNGYVLIPNEAGATVAYIAWIGIEQSPFPKRSGFKDFGLVDLPFPLRKMSVSPVGTLTSRRDRASGATKYELARGVMAFPSVGDQVLMPTPEQVEAIVGARESDKRVRIGASPFASNAAIMVDPDKLFGRHLAVLGNTGSGKSCTVAGLIRWSMEAADKAINDPTKAPNMRFIVLDPNGEYAPAFADMPGRVRVFKPCDEHNPFVLPAWMWNSHEWGAVTQAQPGAQRPLLVQALRSLRAGRALREPLHVGIVRQIRLYRSRMLAYIADGTGASYTDFVHLLSCCQMFKNLEEVMRDFHGRIQGDNPAEAHIDALSTAARCFCNAHKVWSERRGDYNYSAPNAAEFDAFLPLFDAVEGALPAVAPEEEVNEDAPTPFDVRQIADHVDALSAETLSNPNVANFIATMTLRIRSMLADRRLSPVIAPDHPPTFEKWLEGLLGTEGAANGQVAVVDLSLVPSDVTHIVIAVLARLAFEASQRYQKHHEQGKALPTAFVLEEAHTFVRRGGDDDANIASPSRLCRESFERIAREGRKFGLGLVLSSQRPSELSPTVLAQCNTFLLHRIVNDADQNLVARLVPDNVRGLLRELPSLPSRQAILLGWATSIPVLVEVGELPEEQRPRSADPDFWDVWTLAKGRAVDWGVIAKDWSGG